MKCLIAAFCKVTSIDPEAANNLLGNKAEQVLDNLAIGASRFRGLHPQEIIDLSLGFGWAVTEIVVAPAIMKLMTGGDAKRPQLFPVYAEPVARFDFYMQNYVGIAIGTVGSGTSSVKHAVVNDHGVLSDPTGLWKSGDQINVEGLLILSKMHPMSLRLDQQADLAAAMGIDGPAPGAPDAPGAPSETDSSINSDETNETAVQPTQRSPIILP